MIDDENSNSNDTPIAWCLFCRPRISRRVRSAFNVLLVRNSPPRQLRCFANASYDTNRTYLRQALTLSYGVDEMRSQKAVWLEGRRNKVKINFRLALFRRIHRPHEVSAMDKNQKADRPQNEAKLICLLIRHTTSRRTPINQSLMREIIATESVSPRGARNGALFRVS
jgi:hypothetical protein